MDEDDERGDGGGIGLGRTLALSDGIFAIAMTLLAFQVQLPVLHGRETLSQGLGKMGDSYFVFFLSFTVIGAFWMAHHRLFSHVARADAVLMFVNLVFLMTIAALPFPSAIEGRYGHETVAGVFYAASMAAAGSLMTVLILVARGRRLLLPGTPPGAIRRGLWNGGSLAAVFLLSIPVAVVAPRSAPYTWLVLLPIRLLPATRKRSSSRSPSANRGP